MAKEWELTEQDQYCIWSDWKTKTNNDVRLLANDISYNLQKKLLADIKAHVYMVNDTMPCLPPEYYQRLLKAFGLEGK